MYKGELKKYTDSEYAAHEKGAWRGMDKMTRALEWYFEHSAKKRGKKYIIDKDNLFFYLQCQKIQFIDDCTYFGLDRDPEEDED